MREKAFDVGERVVFVLGALAGLVCLTALSVVLVKAAGARPGDWPTWVQAIGSLVGLVIAIAVPWRIHHAGQEQRKAGQLALVVAAAHLAVHATRAMHSSSCKFEDDARRIPLERLKDVQVSFQTLMAKDFPEWALPPVLEILCEVAYQIAAAELHNSGMNNRDDKAENAWKRHQKVAKQSRKLARLTGNPQSVRQAKAGRSDRRRPTDIDSGPSI